MLIKNLDKPVHHEKLILSQTFHSGFFQNFAIVKILRCIFQSICNLETCHIPFYYFSQTLSIYRSKSNNRWCPIAEISIIKYPLRALQDITLMM